MTDDGRRPVTKAHLESLAQVSKKEEEQRKLYMEEIKKQEEQNK